MDNYLRIARLYVRGPFAAVWLFMLVCLVAESAADAEFARQGGILSGVLSRKSYLAMFAYFNACVLGVALRDSMAHPWASLLPRYRQKHLSVASLIAVLFVGIPMFSIGLMAPSNIVPTSVAVIFLAGLAAGLWTLHHPLLACLALPFLLFVFAPATSFPSLATFLTGASPAVSATAACLSLLSLGIFAWRLLALREGTPEFAMARLFGDLLRGPGQAFAGQGRTLDNYLATLPGGNQAAGQNFDWLKISFFTNLKQVDQLSGYTERSLWQRLQLWQLGTQPLRLLATVGQLLVFTPLCILLFVVAGQPARDVVVIFSVQVMMNPFSIWLYWFQRRHRLGYESLRPRTRQEFIRELGLTLLCDISACWLGGILLMVVSAAIWAPELLEVKHTIRFIFCSAVGQLCVYAMGIWPSQRGTAVSVWFALWAFAAIEGWMLFAVMNTGISFQMNIAVASVLAATSVATIALAYRRWCQADLD